jgi:hypothetical protein
VLWRQRSIQSIYTRAQDSLHYTGLHTFARKDFARIREIFLSALEKARAVIEPSPEEELACMCVDFWKI